MDRAERFWLSAPVAWCELDGQWAVFQPANGLISELDDLSAWVLSVLEQQDATAVSLIALAADASAGLSGAVDAALVVEAARALVQAGLVDVRHPVPAPCA